MRKSTLYGKEARDKLLSGVTKISNAVSVTLGPSGRNVLIGTAMWTDSGTLALPNVSTKDGYRTAKSFDLDDPFERVGVVAVKESAQKTVDEAGDGTSSTVVLLKAILEQGIASIEAGGNPIEIKRDIDKAVACFVDQLKSLAVQINGDFDKIFNIATISANNDPVIGQLITNAFRQIGTEGIVNIQAGVSHETIIKKANGYKIANGYLNNIFINNGAKQNCELDNPYILLYQNRINHHTQVERAMTIAAGTNRPLLIVCEDAVEEGLAYLAINTKRGAIKCCVVKAPSIGDERRIEMEDLAILTGGTYISDIRGIDIKEIEPDNLGQAGKVIVTKEDTVIVAPNKDEVELEHLMNELRMNLTQCKNEEERYPIERRIARLQGGIAIIEVGAPTETEIKEKMDRFDDAIRATKAAISEGYIVGGGMAFLKIETGNEIVDIAKKRVFEQICENSGIDPNPHISNLKDHENFNWGYNAKTGIVGDLVQDGVIDPVKVIRCVIQNAGSSAGMILTTEAVIVDVP